MSEEFVIDVSEQDFEIHVLKESFKRPVLVDFWAEWCGPCKMLSPVLESVVASFNGRILLAKVESDKNQSLSAQYGVRGIPAVFMLSNGEVIAQFNGALPEREVRQFIEQHLPSDAEYMVQEANKLLSEKSYSDAEELFQKALLLDTGHEKALMGLIRSLLNQGKIDSANSYLDRANMQNLQFVHLRDFVLFIKDARGEWEVHKGNRQHFQRGCLEDLYARALEHIVAADWSKSLAALLELLKSGKNFRDGYARKAMVFIFGELGPRNELTIKYQKEMARYLY